MPEDNLSIIYAGSERQLLMSFGLLNELMTHVGDLPRVQTIGVDGELRTLILESVFAGRGPKGEVTEPVSVNVLPISPKDAQRVLTWVAEHVIDFFLGAVEAAVATMAPHEARMMAQMPSGNGSAG